jgi:broad specificity phosphatase PhoE
MKVIYLIRHGEVDIDTTTPLNYQGFKAWLARYDEAPLKEENFSSSSVTALVEQSGCVFTSTLLRSFVSAEYLGATTYKKESLFNEVGVVDVPVPFLKLSPMKWLTFFRIAMLLGLRRKGVSMKGHKQKAKEATRYLVEATKEHDSVVLIGHGAMHYLIGKVLEKEGWQCHYRSHKNLEATKWCYEPLHSS